MGCGEVLGSLRSDVSPFLGGSCVDSLIIERVVRVNTLAYVDHHKAKSLNNPLSQVYSF